MTTTPGLFGSAFRRPLSQSTGLPMGVEELARTKAAPNLLGTGLAPGVETRARTMFGPDVGPQPDRVINGGRPFAAQAPGVDPAFLPKGGGGPGLPLGPVKAPAGPDVLQFLPTTGESATARLPYYNLPPVGSPNALSRGAGPRGLGGVAPVAVGSGKPIGLRLLERRARHGDTRAAEALVNNDARANEQRSSQAFTLGLEGQRGQREKDLNVLQFLQQGQRDQATRDFQVGRDDVNHQQQLDVLQFQDGNAEKRYQRGRADKLHDREQETLLGIENITSPDNKSYAVVGNTKGGQRKLISSGMPMAGADPTAEEQQAYVEHAAQSGHDAVFVPGVGGKPGHYAVRPKPAAKEPKAPTTREVSITTQDSAGNPVQVQTKQIQQYDPETKTWGDLPTKAAEKGGPDKSLKGRLGSVLGAFGD